MKKFEKFRREFPKFKYKSYKIEQVSSLKITYEFEIPNLEGGIFKPQWNFPLSSFTIYEKDEFFLSLVFSLGLAEMISYWKLTCSPEISVEAGALNETQKKFWKKLFFKGLGEFFYTNNISPPDKLFDITTLPTEKQEFCIPKGYDQSKVLIPIGGGKDSAVSLELLKNFDRTGFIINPRGASIKTAEVSGLKNLIKAERTLDKNMLALNKKGFLNGHTPFSAIVAFSSLLAAYINKIPFVALSNESSANEATVHNSAINHQYSKSEEFERDFIEYEASFIQSKVKYFSFLRPFTELKIAEIFSRLKGYHEIFKSCNVGSFQDRWCGSCAKCLFVYIILSPFLSAEDLEKIFGNNLFENETLIKTLSELCGMSETKPFECVGSVNEVRLALSETVLQYKKRGQKLPKLLELFNSWNLEGFSDFYSVLESYDENNHLPLEFSAILKERHGK